MMIKILCKWPWVSLECSLDIEVLSQALVPDVFAIAGCDHSTLVFWLQFPDFFLENVVDLLLCWDSVPEEEAVNSVVVLADVDLCPNFISRVGSYTHSPHVFAVLNV